MAQYCHRDNDSMMPFVRSTIGYLSNSWPSCYSIDRLCQVCTSIAMRIWFTRTSLMIHITGMLFALYAIIITKCYSAAAEAG